MKYFILSFITAFLSLFLFGLFYLCIRYDNQLFYVNSNGITFVRCIDFLQTIDNMSNSVTVFSLDEIKNNLSGIQTQFDKLVNGSFMDFIYTNVSSGQVSFSSLFSGDFWNIFNNLIEFFTFPLKLICTVLVLVGGMITAFFTFFYQMISFFVTFMLALFNPVVIELPIII